MVRYHTVYYYKLLTMNCNYLCVQDSSCKVDLHYASLACVVARDNFRDTLCWYDTDSVVRVKIE